MCFVVEQGIINSDVLVGIQVKKSEMDEFHKSARKLGYRYQVISGDGASQFLLKR